MSAPASCGDSQLLDFLANTPLFSSLPAEAMTKLADSLSLLEFSDGALLFREGDPSDSFYLIMSGAIEIVKAIATNEETILARRGAGEMIGEMGLLNQDGRRTSSVRAVGRVCALSATYSELNTVVAHYPTVAYQLASILSGRMTAEQNDTIRILREKNEDLQRAYDELKAAQEQLIEKEKLERELLLAYEIQQSILPQVLPHLLGYNFGALMQPARAVGGDFFGLFELGNERVGLVVGDITDKGVPAAIFMAQTHALLRAAASPQLAPGETLAKVNRFLLEMNQKGLFATVIYVILHRPSGRCYYARAGHELPLLVSPYGELSYPPMLPGTPLGILERPVIDIGVLTLPPGGKLVLYTDGVIDAVAPDRSRYDDTGLECAVLDTAGLDAQATCQSLLKSVITFQQNLPQFDDITMLVVQRDLDA